MPTATTAQAASTPYIVASTSAGNNSSLAAKTNRPGIPQTVKLKVIIYVKQIIKPLTRNEHLSMLYYCALTINLDLKSCVTDLISSSSYLINKLLINWFTFRLAIRLWRCTQLELESYLRLQQLGPVDPVGPAGKFLFKNYKPECKERNNKNSINISGHQFLW